MKQNQKAIFGLLAAAGVAFLVFGRKAMAADGGEATPALGRLTDSNANAINATQQGASFFTSLLQESLGRSDRIGGENAAPAATTSVAANAPAGGTRFAPRTSTPLVNSDPAPAPAPRPVRRRSRNVGFLGGARRITR